MNDYEGIGTFESYRGDLGSMYFATVEPQTGTLYSLQMVPTQIKHFKVNTALKDDELWLCNVLDHESEKLGCNVAFNGGFLWLKWS